MMIEEIGKKMPFREDGHSVTLLLAHATERALQADQPMTRSHTMWRIAAMLVFLLTVGSTGWLWINHTRSRQYPLDDFLESMSEDDLQELREYCAAEALANEWEWDDSDFSMD